MYSLLTDPVTREGDTLLDLIICENKLVIVKCLVSECSVDIYGKYFVYFICMPFLPSPPTHTHARTHTHAPFTPPHTHAHASTYVHMHKHTQAHTHAHKHTHTQIVKVSTVTQVVLVLFSRRAV